MSSKQYSVCVRLLSLSQLPCRARIQPRIHAAFSMYTLIPNWSLTCSGVPHRKSYGRSRAPNISLAASLTAASPGRAVSRHSS